MPVYELVPRDARHPDWVASEHKGAVRIHTASELAAREAAAAQFESGMANTSDVSPWLNPDRVRARVVPQLDQGSYSEGQIEIADPARAVETFDDVDSFDDLAELDPLTPYRIIRPGKVRTSPDTDFLGAPPGGGYAPAAAPDYRNGGIPNPQGNGNFGFAEAQGFRRGPVDVVRFGGSGVVPAPGSRGNGQRVRLLTEHRLHFKTQSAVMLALIDDVLAPALGRNTPRTALWHADDDEDARLTALLSEVRDELRRLNEALDRPQPEPAKVSKIASALGSVGTGFLHGFGKVLGTGAGCLFLYELTNMLLSLGFIDPTIAASILNFAIGAKRS